MAEEYLTWARVDISGVADTNYKQIIINAGGNPDKALFRNGIMFIPNIPQNSLTDAWNTFNHSQFLVDQKWKDVRDQRKDLLKKSDKTQLLDYPMERPGLLSKIFLGTQDPVEAWKLYRQQLRDITKQADPFNIVWPTPPENI